MCELPQTQEPFSAMNRAKRRHHRFRVRRRAQKILKSLLGDLYTREYAAKRAEHLASCSCPMCGNPRTWFGERTRQETLHGGSGDRAIEDDVFRAILKHLATG